MQSINHILSPSYAESITIYDDIDADVLRNYQEFTLANIIFYSLKESTTSEQSARMTAMDNASKNACKENSGTYYAVCSVLRNSLDVNKSVSK